MEEGNEEPQTACFEWGAPDEETRLAEVAETGDETFEDADLAESIWEESEADCEIEISWDSEVAVILPEMEETLIAEESSTQIPVKTRREDVFAMPEHVFLEEELVEDHYALLDKGIAPNPANRASRDWDDRDAVEELRAEEAAFAVPPSSSGTGDFTVIESLPLPGEEWQPEDIQPADRKPITTDASKIIDQVMPLIDAALSDDCPTIELGNNAAEGSKEPAAKRNPNTETIIANVFAMSDSGTTRDLDSLPIVIDYLPPREPNRHAATANQYFLQSGSEESGADMEERIARTVLDTYTEVQTLMWHSTTQSERENEIEPPTRVAGGEPIRDPGDPVPFDELRKCIEKALDATKPINETIAVRPEPAPTETKNLVPRQPAIEYDIVLPEPDDNPAETGPVSRTDAPNTDEDEKSPARRSYNNLFSKIRHRKQA
jgi:hypothetical protein